MRALASQSSVGICSQWVLSFGWTIKVEGLVLAQKRVDWREFSDHGDFEFGHEPMQRAEVKKLTHGRFTGAHDYPWPDRLIVIKKDRWDRYEPRPPDRVFICNMDWSHVAIVHCGTFARWRVERIKGADYWIAPLDCVKFYPLTFGPGGRVAKNGQRARRRMLPRPSQIIQAQQLPLDYFL
jgi:hypothetical protein